MYSITKILTLMLFCTQMAITNAQSERANVDIAPCLKNEETQWKVEVIDHPDLSNTFGDISVSGGEENVRKFFSEVPVSVYPECNQDTRNIDSFFDVFTETEARAIDITLHCSCCPLKCKLTISISF